MSLRSFQSAIWQRRLRLLFGSVFAIAGLAWSVSAEEPDPPPEGTRDAESRAPRLAQGAKGTDEKLHRAAMDRVALSAREYVRRRDCFSCHHQTLPTWAWSAAERGRPRETAGRYSPDLGQQAEFTQRDFTRRLDQLLAGETDAAPGGPFTAGYALLQFAELDAPADAVTEGLVRYLESQQDRAGGWWIRPLRPPLEQSRFTSTALALRGLQWYAPPSSSREQRLRRAARWLQRETPTTTEDHVFRAWGIAWSDVDSREWFAALRKLVERQRPDGGWSREGERPSDAYSTAQAVSLLRWGERARTARRAPRGAGDWGAPTGVVQRGAKSIEPGTASSAEQATYDAAIERGQRWLRERRQADGTWLVESDAEPVQEYFESGFPHGRSQFLSIAATCWAVIALVDQPPRALVEVPPTDMTRVTR